MLHQAAFFAAIIVSVALVSIARPGGQSWATLVFGGSLVLLFGTSALYHRVLWRTRARALLQRFDHAAIFVSIAGAHTPLFALVPSTRGGHSALLVVWIGAAIGIARSFIRPEPAWVTAVLSMALGAVTISPVLDRVPSAGAGVVALFVLSGALYVVGGIVFIAKRPDPVPRVFGYHEVFHALIVVGTVSLFAHAALLLRAT